jgi:hypothetical protein
MAKRLGPAEVGRIAALRNAENEGPQWLINVNQKIFDDAVSVAGDVAVTPQMLGALVRAFPYRRSRDSCTAGWWWLMARRASASSTNALGTPLAPRTVVDAAPILHLDNFARL